MRLFREVYYVSSSYEKGSQLSSALALALALANSIQFQCNAMCNVSESCSVPAPVQTRQTRSSKAKKSSTVLPRKQWTYPQPGTTLHWRLPSEF